MDSIHQFLRNIPFFKSLPPDDITAICAACHEERFEQETVIFREGEIGDRVYIIVEGEVRIWKNHGGPQPYTLTLLAPGDMFGEMALIDQRPRSATAVVEGHAARLLSVFQHDFAAFIERRFTISLAIMRALSSTLRKSNENYINRLRDEKHHLELTNQALQEKIEEHRIVAAELKTYRNHLENLVGDRTAELMDSNRQLKKEIEDRNRSEELRKKTETQLRETSVLLETVFNAIPDVLGVHGTDKTIIRYNQAGTRFLSSGTSSLVGRKCYELIRRNSPCEQCAALEVQRTKKPARVVKYMDDPGVWLDARAYPVVNDNGEITQIVEHFRDITEEKRADAALRESEEKYRMLVENASEAIFIIQDGKIKFANSVTAHIGSRLSLALDREPFFSFIHPDDREVVESRLRSVEKDPQSLQVFSFRLLNKEGEIMWAELNAAKISWEGEPAMLHFLRDITHHKKMEEEFYKAQRMEALGTLAGGIAHNFNNLLQVIQGNVSFILLDRDHGYPYQDEMKSISQSVENGANLTRQLLGFARAGHYLVKPSNMNDIIDKTAHMFARTCKGIKIHKYFQKNIWTVEVDHGQVELVLLNLFINARQAMNECGDLYLATENVILTPPKVEAYKAAPGPYVRVSITDTGMGMDESVRVKIFEPFFTTKEEGEGTGLGLASAYGIIRRHGGFIHVQSEKGRGTTFNIFFIASEKESISVKSPDEDWEAGSETIMLVDDEDMVVKIGELMLKEMGYQVILARGGRMAIEKFQQQYKKIDLVILDIIMPDMDGRSVYERLKLIHPQARILLSSGYGIDGTAATLLENGCDGFIPKPFNMSQLSREIRKILEKKRPGQ
ncbi:MAG: PAS domain S-box protein [Thermodesulfobacteriota bacterium]